MPKKTLEDAYHDYRLKYLQNVREGQKNGMKPSTAIELTQRMLTPKEFRENIEIMRDEIRAEGKRASSATKLGQKLANEQTRLRSEKQVTALRGAFKGLKEQGEWEGKVPTRKELRYSENQDFFNMLKGKAEDLGIDYSIYAAEVFGS